MNDTVFMQGHRAGLDLIAADQATGGSPDDPLVDQMVLEIQRRGLDG